MHNRKVLSFCIMVLSFINSILETMVPNTIYMRFVVLSIFILSVLLFIHEVIDNKHKPELFTALRCQRLKAA